LRSASSSATALTAPPAALLVAVATTRHFLHHGHRLCWQTAHPNAFVVYHLCPVLILRRFFVLCHSGCRLLIAVTARVACACFDRGRVRKPNADDIQPESRHFFFQVPKCVETLLVKDRHSSSETFSRGVRGVVESLFTGACGKEKPVQKSVVLPQGAITTASHKRRGKLPRLHAVQCPGHHGPHAARAGRAVPRCPWRAHAARGATPADN